VSELARRGAEIADAAADRGLPLRLLGGVAVHLRLDDAVPAGLRRSHADVDVVVARSAGPRTSAFLTELGLTPDVAFNTMSGGGRQRWSLPGPPAPDGGPAHLDVFVGRFRMCHDLDLEPRIPVEPRTIPAADLLATKLQIVELTAKDVTDAAALLLTHELAPGDGPGRLSVTRLVELTSTDWGWYTTLTDNLERLRADGAAVPAVVRPAVARRAGRLADALREAPKSRTWRLRARLGRARRWYRLPEEA
jgi:hypothetical protein